MAVEPEGVKVPANKIGLKVSANYGSGKMRLSLVKGQAAVGTMIIDTKQASSVAATVLATAAKVFELSGKPPPYRTKEDEITLSSTPCSGWNIGPGQSATSVMLIFHFGETTLGIPIPQSDARLFAQRLMTAATPSDSPRQH
jgi:hypothetical protein